MQEQFARTRLLLGPKALDALHRSSIAVFGVGGVGGYVVEVLARSGVGVIHLFDNDIFSVSNLNRQLHALHSTLDRYKVDVAVERIHDIYPECEAVAHRMFYLPENADEVDLSQFDYVVDCIDTMKAKLELARRCHHLGIPLISSMGAANKLDPTAFRVADLSKTKMDPLAKVMRQQLRKEGIYHLRVVYSEEPPLCPLDDDNEKNGNDSRKRTVPASNAFVPAAAGLVIGGEVVKDLIRRADAMRQ
ncbi:MAG: tRNA threonylcarbamoyladenosine dehydratase [Bacteroidaceae bacterium]|nr:tRNA threonylcarbamoyladenosine dehydratase [Bacteroidaceae bacterium]